MAGHIALQSAGFQRSRSPISVTLLYFTVVALQSACGGAPSSALPANPLDAGGDGTERETGVDSGRTGDAATLCVNPTPETCADASIQASDYVQTCTADSDCIVVGQGDLCSACALTCSSGSINKSSFAAYQAAANKILDGPDPVSCAPCCRSPQVACCQGGTCHVASQCN